MYGLLPYAIENGAISLTWIVIVPFPLPPRFVAVTVYTVDGETTVGVPLISPVAASKIRPVGRGGEMVHELTAPPLRDGVTAPIGAPLVRV